jgi:hypothetical protein
VSVYTHNRQGNVNLLVPGSYSWTISIPDRDLNMVDGYVVRFMYPVDTFDSTLPALESPSFIVMGGSAYSNTALPIRMSSDSVPSTIFPKQSQTSGVTSLTVINVASSAQSLSGAAANNTSASTESNASVQAVKIGIAVGISLCVTVLGLIGVFVYLIFLRRAKIMSREAISESESALPPSYEHTVSSTNATRTVVVEMRSEREVGELEDVKSRAVERHELP